MTMATTRPRGTLTGRQLQLERNTGGAEAEKSSCQAEKCTVVKWVAHVLDGKAPGPELTLVSGLTDFPIYEYT